ncbi:MAG: Mrp/NBP35 family ATP-binding protein [Desulfomonilaceae bacterium]
MSDASSCEKNTTCGQCDSAGACDAATQQRHAEEQLKAKLQSIKHRLVIMSGKGGVGKTTVTTNLAVALAKMGLKVGVLDGDVHGPNIPRMLGVDKDGLQMGPNGLLPATARDNVKVMSMAFILQSEDTPVAWRGPMKHSLFQQFLSEVDWGPLDYLVVDLPPGTGDEPLSIAQLLGEPLWTIIVTTPQDVALLDSRKSVVFGKTLNMNVLGIIENMSGLVCPHCGGKIDLFKTGGGERSARELGVPFLGAIPIDPSVVIGGDAGVPIMYDHADSRSAEAFKTLAEDIHKKIQNSHKA